MQAILEAPFVVCAAAIFAVGFVVGFFVDLQRERRNLNRFLQEVEAERYRRAKEKGKEEFRDWLKDRSRFVDALADQSKRDTDRFLGREAFEKRNGA